MAKNSLIESPRRGVVEPPREGPVGRDTHSELPVVAVVARRFLT